LPYFARFSRFFFSSSNSLRANIARLEERTESIDDHRIEVDPGNLEENAERDARATLPGEYHMVNWQALSALRVGGLVAATRQDMPPWALPVS
jgi:hypothetical protein